MAFQPDQIKLQREPAIAEFNARVEAQRQEILNWQQVWQEKLDKLEADRKTSLAESATDVSHSTVTKAEVKKPEIVEPEIPDTDKIAQKTTEPTTPAKRKVVVKKTLSKYDRLIAKNASEYGVPVKLAHAIVKIEADRRASLAEANVNEAKADVVEAIVAKAEVAEPETPKIHNVTQKTAKPVTSTKRKVVVKKARSKYDRLIAKYAGEYGVPIKLAHAIVKIESSYRADARGSVGEIGLMQVRLSTARGMGYSGGAKGLYLPETNLKYGMKYLGKAFKLGGGSTCGAILKYNAGHGAKRMNATSAKYCEKVKAYI